MLLPYVVKCMYMYMYIKSSDDGVLINYVASLCSKVYSPPCSLNVVLDLFLVGSLLQESSFQNE